MKELTSDQIVIQPVLTEKSNMMREEDEKKYTFMVHRIANKKQVMTAVMKIFNVEPKACNIVNVKPKNKKSNTQSGRRRGYGSRDAWKKAIVTLPKNQKIDIFEGA